MTRHEPGEKDARAVEALAKLVHAQVQPPTTAELEHGLRAVFGELATGEAGPSIRRRVRWWLAGGAALASLSALALWLVWQTPVRHAIGPATPTLAYRVEGGTVVAGGYLRESSAGGVKLAFTDGTEFVLMPGTRGRLRSVGGAGARIAIEQGTASFQVTPGTGRTWLVDVGPFLVTVKGTVFTVTWDPLHERFELRLRRGHVVVSGPLSGGDVDLHDGQRVVVNLPRAETLISNDDAPPPDKAPADAPAAGGNAEAPRPGPAPAARRTRPTVTAKSASPEGPRRWNEALANGDWDTILSDVDRLGAKAIIETASSEELFALADAARYRRRLELARDALLAQRRRYPASARAMDAVFLLGRVEEASDRGSLRALRWYDDYLARAPTGNFASEALGRKMTLTNELEGAARARPIADEYLRRFPAGTYAGAARALQH